MPCEVRCECTDVTSVLSEPSAATAVSLVYPRMNKGNQGGHARVYSRIVETLRALAGPTGIYKHYVGVAYHQVVATTASRPTETLPSAPRDRKNTGCWAAHRTCCDTQPPWEAPTG